MKPFDRLKKRLAEENGLEFPEGTICRRIRTSANQRAAGAIL